MASYFPIRGKVRAVIRRKGHKPISKIHPNQRAAEKWARGVEADIDRKLHGDASDRLVGDLVDEYIKALPQMNYNKRHTLRILKRELGSLRAADLTVDRLIKYANERSCGPVTLRTDFAYLSAMLRYANTVWRLRLPNHTLEVREVLKQTGRVRRSAHRDRRPTEDELNRIRDWFDAREAAARKKWKGRRFHPMRDIIDFAVATAMRAEEIARIRWSDLDEKNLTVVIRDRKDPKEKIGNDQTVPLLKISMEIIKRQPRIDARIFPYNHDSWSNLFPRACAALGIKDLRFHDLRHEGISRLFEMGYDIHEVAMFSGHRDWESLKRYTQLRPANLRRLA